MTQRNLVALFVTVTLAFFAILSVRFVSSTPTAPSTDALAAIVRTQRGQLDALRVCMSGAGPWSLTASTALTDGGAPVPEARAAQCRPLLAPLGLSSAHARPDGSVVFFTWETGKSARGVGAITDAARFLAESPGATVSWSEDDWYLVLEDR